MSSAEFTKFSNELKEDQQSVQEETAEEKKKPRKKAKSRKKGRGDGKKKRVHDQPDSEEDDRTQTEEEGSESNFIDTFPEGAKFVSNAHSTKAYRSFMLNLAKQRQFKTEDPSVLRNYLLQRMPSFNRLQLWTRKVNRSLWRKGKDLFDYDMMQRNLTRNVKTALKTANNLKTRLYKSLVFKPMIPGATIPTIFIGKTILLSPLNFYSSFLHRSSWHFLRFSISTLYPSLLSSSSLALLNALLLSLAVNNHSVTRIHIYTTSKITGVILPDELAFAKSMKKLKHNKKESCFSFSVQTQLASKTDENDGNQYRWFDIGLQEEGRTQPLLLKLLFFVYRREPEDVSPTRELKIIF